MASRIRAALDREALVNGTINNGKGEQLNGAEKRPKINAHQRLGDVDSKANLPDFRNKPTTGISDTPPVL